VQTPVRWPDLPRPWASGNRGACNRLDVRVSSSNGGSVELVRAIEGATVTMTDDRMRSEEEVQRRQSNSRGQPPNMVEHCNRRPKEKYEHEKLLVMMTFCNFLKQNCAFILVTELH
jgi:hypothetical protein